jgi:hypothetical protein
LIDTFQTVLVSLVLGAAVGVGFLIWRRIFRPR